MRPSAAVEEDSRRIAKLAARRALTISYEFHADSLTDTTESAVALLQAVQDRRIRTYWQPSLAMTHAEKLASLSAVRRWLTHVHAYYYVEGSENQRPLAEGQTQWLDYLSTVARIGGDHYVMLEFVPDSTAESLLREAATLNSWLNQINKE